MRAPPTLVEAPEHAPQVVEPKRRGPWLIVVSALAVVFLVASIVLGMAWNNTRGQLTTSQDHATALQTQVSDLQGSNAALNGQVTDLKAVVASGREYAVVSHSLITHMVNGLNSTTQQGFVKEINKANALYDRYQTTYGAFMQASKPA